MTDDQQEAESRKYGNSVLMVLPLASGRWAVFDAARSLHHIVTAEELLFALCHMPPIPSRAPSKMAEPFDLLKELGL